MDWWARGVFIFCGKTQLALGRRKSEKPEFLINTTLGFSNALPVSQYRPTLVFLKRGPGLPHFQYHESVGVSVFFAICVYFLFAISTLSWQENEIAARALCVTTTLSHPDWGNLACLKKNSSVSVPWFGECIFLVPDYHLTVAKKNS